MGALPSLLDDERGWEEILVDVLQLLRAKGILGMLLLLLRLFDFICWLAAVGGESLSAEARQGGSGAETIDELLFGSCKTWHRRRCAQGIDGLSLFWCRGVLAEWRHGTQTFDALMAVGIAQRRYG